MDPSPDPPDLVSPAPAEPASVLTAPPTVAAVDGFAADSLEDAERRAESDAEPPAVGLEIETTSETLSPAVRRLVRQYDLDVTGIHGTGPSGRIRVSDVIGLLGNRADSAARPSEPPRDGDERTGLTPVLFRNTNPNRAAGAAPAAAPAAATPATTVFECDLSRVLSHRREQRRNGVDLLITSYCLAACADALKTVPEIAAPPPHFGVSLSAANGELRTTVVSAADEPAHASSNDRLRAFDEQLRASGDADLAGASLLIHHYGLSGSLLATPTPLGAGHAASLGIGRVRREVVVKSTDGDEAPRISAVCYVTLSFLPDRLPLTRANRFLAQLVRVLEQWPE